MPNGFDLAALKARTRQRLHETLAVAALYEDAETPPTAITVRWHNKLVKAGAEDGGFGVEVFSGIDRLVFNTPEITSKGLILVSGGYVEVPQYNARFSLEAQEPADGPINDYWTVAAIQPEQAVVPDAAIGFLLVDDEDQGAVIDEDT